MAADWDSYLCLVNKAPASIALDLDLEASAPQAKRPQLLWLWVSLLAPRADGLSQSSELRMLSAIGEQLEATLAERLQALLAGRITTRGRREFYFYAPSSEGIGTALSVAMARFPEYSYQYGDQPDPGWSQYLQVLYPETKNLQGILTRRTVDALQGQGDLLHLARDVTHYVHFPSEERRRAFVIQATRMGFRIRHQGFDAQDETGCPFELEIERRDPVDLESIEGVVFDLCDRAEELGAVYGGWETHVVQESLR